MIFLPRLAIPKHAVYARHCPGFTLTRSDAKSDKLGLFFLLQLTFGEIEKKRGGFGAKPNV